MSTQDLPKLETTLEPERYELNAGPAYHFQVDRRDFFKFLGAGILVVCVLKDTNSAQESGRGGHPAGEALPKEIGAWMHIGEDGSVTVYTGKVEVGQNVRTSLTQAVSEELSVPPDKITLTMGDTKLTPYDRGTFGSLTTPVMNLQLRRVASAARDVLVTLAAKQWQVDAKSLVAANGKVTDPASKRSIEYAALAKGQLLTETLPAEDPLIPATQWKVAGQSLPKVDGRDFVTGKHLYPSDQKLPGMLHGKIVRPTAFNATLVSLDTKEAEQMPGVVVVHDGNFVGVAAPTVQLASKAVASIKAEWKADPQPSNKELFDVLKKTAAEGADPTGDAGQVTTGSVDQAMAAADHACNRLTRFPTSRMFRWSRARRWRSGTATRSPYGQEPKDHLVSALTWPRHSICGKIASACSCLIRVRHMGENTPGRRRSRRPGWRGLPNGR